MSRRILALKLIVAALAATIAFHPASPSTAAAGNRIVIAIQKFKFASPDQEIKPGDTIVWVNKDFVPHTATAQDGSWDSGSIAPNTKWEMVVKEGVSQAYFCAFHPSMTARIDLRPDKTTRSAPK